MAVKRTLGKLLLALVAATWLPPQAVICCASSESESCFAACCWVSCFLQATLAGWHGHRKPVSEHRDLDIARWLVQSKDFLVNLCSGLGSVATTFQAGVGPLLWCQHTNLAAQAQTLCFQLSGRPLPLATSKAGGCFGHGACRPERLCLSGRCHNLLGNEICLSPPGRSGFQHQALRSPHACCKPGHVVWRNCVFRETTSEAASTESARMAEAVALCGLSRAWFSV